MRRGGQALLRRRFSAKTSRRADVLARYGSWHREFPTAAPRPCPSRSLSLRRAAGIPLEIRGYGNERAFISLLRVGILAVYYGRRVLTFLRDNGIASSASARRSGWWRC